MTRGGKSARESWRRWAVTVGRRLRLGREDGQALIEFAFVLVPLLLIIFGGIEFGRAWNAKNDTVHLANEAVRYAAVDQLTSANCTSIINEASLDKLTASIQVTQTPLASGDPVTVKVTVPFNTVVPLLSDIMNFSSLSGTATMRFEGPSFSGACY